MIQVSEGWEMQVERGPDWLFVRPYSIGGDFSSTPPWAEQMWTLLEQYQTRRLVVDLEQVPLLHSYLIGQLVALHKRICTHGGLMRLCGVSLANQQVLRLCRLDERFPPYYNRGDAVMGHYCPPQPR